MPLNLSPSMAAAVQSATKAVEFEGATIHIEFDPVDLFVTEAGWLTVRGGLNGYEEHLDLTAFESAYKLDSTQPELLALAYELDGMCAIFLLHTQEEGNRTAMLVWGSAEADAAQQ